MWKIPSMLIVLFFCFQQVRSAYCADEYKTVPWADFLAKTFIIHGFSHRGKDFSQEPPPHADISFPNVQAYAKPYNPFVHTTIGEFVFPHQCSWECRMSALVAPAAQYLPRMMLGNVQDLLLANIRTDPIDLSKTAMIVPQWMGDAINEDKQYKDLKKMATDNGVKIVSYPAYEMCDTLLNVPLSQRNPYSSHYHPGPRTLTRKTLREAVEEYAKSQGMWHIMKCPDDAFDYTKKRFDYMPWPLPPYEKLCIERTPPGQKDKCHSEVTTPWYYVSDLRVHAQSVFNPIHTIMNKDGDKTVNQFCPADKKSNFYLVRSKTWTKTIREWITASSAKNDESGKPISQASYDHLNEYKKRLTEYGFVADLYCATVQYARTERAKETDLKDAALATQKAKTRACTQDSDLSIKKIGDYLASGLNLDFLGMFSTPAFARKATRPKVEVWPVGTPYDPNDRPKTSFFKHNPKTFGYFLEQLAITRCALDPAHIPTRPVPAPPVVVVVPQAPQLPQAPPVVQQQPPQVPQPPPVVQQQPQQAAKKTKEELDYEREQESFEFYQLWSALLEDDFESRTLEQGENGESLESEDLWLENSEKDIEDILALIKKSEDEEAAELLKQQQQEQQEHEEQQSPPDQQQKKPDKSSEASAKKDFLEIRQKFKDRRIGQLEPDYDEEE